MLRSLARLLAFALVLGLLGFAGYLALWRPAGEVPAKTEEGSAKLESSAKLAEFNEPSAPSEPPLTLISKGEVERWESRQAGDFSAKLRFVGDETYDTKASMAWLSDSLLMVTTGNRGEWYQSARDYFVFESVGGALELIFASTGWSGDVGWERWTPPRRIHVRYFADADEIQLEYSFVRAVGPLVQGRFGLRIEDAEGVEANPWTGPQVLADVTRLLRQ